jgi:hypothetical protein
MWGAQPPPRSDLYCLGVVAHRCLADPTELCAGDASDTALLPTAIPRMPRLGKVRPDLPRGLIADVQQAVALDPDSRQKLGRGVPRAVAWRAGKDRPGAARASDDPCVSSK